MSDPRSRRASVREELLADWDAGLQDKTALGRKHGVRRHKVYSWLRESGRIAPEYAADGTAPDAAPGAAASGETAGDAAKFARTEQGDTTQLDFTTDQRIRTLDDALAYAEVDQAVWRVKKWSCTSWEVVLKLSQYEPTAAGNRVKVSEQPARKTMWRVRLDLERIIPRPLHQALETIFDRMKGYSPRYPRIHHRKQPGTPHLLVLDLMDVHFAKLAWGKETGTDYDLKIAEAVFVNAVDDLLNCTAGFKIDQILLPLGNDFFHVDNARNTTTSGTPQDTDGRYQKIYEVGFQAVIWAVERLMQQAPTQVYWVPGNHDRTISWHLAHELGTWFRLCDHVTVDAGPKIRKYHRYGATLLGFTHGNLEKHRSLPTIMATEEKQRWADTTTHEWHVGHWHQSKKVEFASTDTQDGVVVRTLRSLAGTDFWHYSMGYLSSNRAAEAHLYSFDRGFAGSFNAPARD